MIKSCIPCVSTQDAVTNTEDNTTYTADILSVLETEDLRPRCQQVGFS